LKEHFCPFTKQQALTSSPNATNSEMKKIRKGKRRVIMTGQQTDQRPPRAANARRLPARPGDE